eukprot:7557342-Ditylum_brightwellii.AAC.1
MLESPSKMESIGGVRRNGCAGSDHIGMANSGEEEEGYCWNPLHLSCCGWRGKHLHQMSGYWITVHGRAGSKPDSLVLVA